MIFVFGRESDELRGEMMTVQINTNFQHSKDFAKCFLYSIYKKAPIKHFNLLEIVTIYKANVFELCDILLSARTSYIFIYMTKNIF